VDVLTTLERLDASRLGLVTVQQLLRAGVTRPALSRAVRQGQVLRLGAGVYGSAPLPDVPRFVTTDAGPAPAYVIRVLAALYALGDSATASGRTAAALRGWGMLVEPARTIEVSVPHGRGRASGTQVRLRQRRRLARERWVPGAGAKGIWVTTALQTVIDCSLALPLLEAVVVLDSALRARAITVEEVDRAAGRLSGHRDAARARQVLLLCDPANGSVLETVLRVRMALAGLSGFTSQYEVTGPRGQPVFRVDFCAEAVRLVIETDGARWHPDPPRDQARDNALAARGWRVLRFTWAQVVDEPQLVLELIREALECRAAA